MQVSLKSRGGFIKLVLLIVIALVVLGFFGYNLREIIDSPDVKDNLATVWEWVKAAWRWLVSFIKDFIPQKTV